MGTITTDVGNIKLFENDKITVWDFRLEPGEETPMHKHIKDYIYYVVQGAPLECTAEDGSELGVVPANTDSLFHLKMKGNDIEVLDGPGKGATMPGTHKAKNVGNETYREILIEFNK